MSDLPDFGDEFEVVRTLGRGSMSTVYLARDVALRRMVALKVLGSRWSADRVAKQRFEREGQAAARLTHPNIVAVHRVASLADGTPYLVMEHIEGRNLADALAAGTVDAEAALTILLQVAQALAAAHAERIVHRDVRPANIVWNAEADRAVLMDFGIAAVLESGSEAVTRLTKAGEILGDARYSSPEQLMGEPLTGEADVYALAILGYELVCGRDPFDAQSTTALINAHLKGKPRQLSELAPSAPKELGALLSACLAKQPAQRPSASNVAAKLEALHSGEAVSSGLFGSAAMDTAAGNLPVLQSFVKELQRRHVFNVVFVYAALSFGALQIGELILPELPLPPWSYTALVALTLAGFPVAMVLAWAYDLTAEGIRKTEERPALTRGAKAMMFFGFVLSLVVAGLIGWWILGA